MKNRVFYILALAAVLASCAREVDLPDGFDKKYVTVSFSAAAGVETKAETSDVESFESDLESEAFEKPFTLSCIATQNTDDPSVAEPMTKGEAVTAENLGSFTVDMCNTDGSLYKTGTAGGDSAVGEYSAIYDADGNKLEWPSDGSTYDFWAFNSLSSDAGESYTHDTENNCVVYYGASADKTAADMTDFVVAFSEVKHNHAAQNLVNLKFYHALAAVRFNFDLGSAAADGFSVEKVQITNIYNKGTFTINPSVTNFNDKFKWEVYDDTITYTYSPDEDDTNAEKTFYIIPQALGDVKIVFTLVKGDKRYQMTAKANQLVNEGGDLKWEPGYVYTYTVSTPDGNVGVDVGGAFDGTTLKNAVITNPKRSTVYVRAFFVPNWCNDNNEPVYPPTADTYRAIVANILSNNDGWVYGTDEILYYTKPVLGYSSTADLINILTLPEDAPMSGVHFELKILAQSVECDDNGDDKLASLRAAWGTPYGVYGASVKPIEFETF